MKYFYDDLVTTGSQTLIGLSKIEGIFVKILVRCMDERTPHVSGTPHHINIYVMTHL